MSLTAKLLLSPLLLAQALGTRRRLPRLPEAAGRRHGRVGRGPVLRLLVAGDSSAAGVGAHHQRDALAGRLASLLAEACGTCVEWRLAARTGLTTAQTLHFLRREAFADGRRAMPRHFDVAVVVTGVNDIIEQVPSHHAVSSREVLANWLRNALGVAHVVFAPLPPVHLLPGLPQPLRWVSGEDARRHDRALTHWASTRGDVSRPGFELPLHRGVLAIDGFHPGEPVYHRCAQEIAQHIARHVWPQLHLETSHGTQPSRQDPVHHRLEPGHRPGDRLSGRGGRRQHRAGGQDHRAQPEAAGNAAQRRR